MSNFDSCILKFRIQETQTTFLRLMIHINYLKIKIASMQKLTCIIRNQKTSIHTQTSFAIAYINIGIWDLYITVSIESIGGSWDTYSLLFSIFNISLRALDVLFIALSAILRDSIRQSYWNAYIGTRGDGIRTVCACTVAGLNIISEWKMENWNWFAIEIGQRIKMYLYLEWCWNIVKQKWGFSSNKWQF